MRLLLDTHVWIWWSSQPDRLNSRVLRSIESGANEVFVSAASFWEIAVKISCGRLRIDGARDPFFLSRLSEQRVKELPIIGTHALMSAETSGRLKDPFDRMLVAQARCEKLRLVTADRKILAGGGDVLSAV